MEIMHDGTATAQMNKKFDISPKIQYPVFVTKKWLIFSLQDLIISFSLQGLQKEGKYNTKSL